jgi:hypothetical protein
MVEAVAPVSPLGRGDGFDVPAAVLMLFLEELPSWLLVSSTSCVAPLPTAPTASLNRVYSPLRPCCTRSPVVDLLSEVGNEPGGGAKSLKVVRASDWLADVWILSRLREKCSLSACEDTESDVAESRRDREVTGEGGSDGPRDGCRRPLVLVLAIVPYFV